MKDRTAILPPPAEKIDGVYGSFDLLKVLLAYIIIIRHVAQAFLPSDSICYALICGAISTAGVPIYFILSGYLFFVKPFSTQRLGRQLLRIFKLYLAWTVIYAPVILLRNIRNHVPLLKGVYTFILDFVYSGSYFHLWYLPALIFALAFVSLLRSMRMRYAIPLITGLFMAGLLLETYRSLVLPLSGVIEAYTKVFLTTKNGLFFGVPYVYIGYVFSQRDLKIKRSHAVLGITVSFLLLCVEGVTMFRYQGISLAHMTIFALPLSLFTFLFARQVKVNIRKDSLLCIRKLSTALYCVHPIFIIAILFIDLYIIALPTVCIFALTMLASTVASAMIVKLSGKCKLLSYFV